MGRARSPAPRCCQRHDTAFPLPQGRSIIDRAAGSWKDGKLHGFATVLYQNGASYKGLSVPSNTALTAAGMWRADARHGHGFLVSETGWRYLGAWDSDAKHGYGGATSTRAQASPVSRRGLRSQARAALHGPVGQWQSQRLLRHHLCQWRLCGRQAMQCIRNRLPMSPQART